MLGKNIKYIHLERQAHRAGLTHQPFSLSQIEDEIKGARTILRNTRKQHQEERTNFLQQLLEEYSQQYNLSAQHILQTLIDQEHMKKSITTYATL
jgi:hypothetical protein